MLVMDNLNTHHPASLYEAFEPAEARRIAGWLEVHNTPKHGSWLDMAEIEIGVMARQCLDRRIPDQSALRREVGAWQQQRNRDAIRVDSALHHLGCAHQTAQIPLPINTTLSEFLGAGTRSQRGTTPAGAAIMPGQSLLILGTTYS